MSARQAASVPLDYVGPLPSEVLTALRRQAQSAGRRIVTIDLSACRNKNGVLAAIGTALEFPAYYGANFDALADCLADLAAPPGWLIVLQGLAAGSSMSDEERTILRDCLRDAAVFHAAQGNVFQVVWH